MALSALRSWGWESDRCGCDERCRTKVAYLPNTDCGVGDENEENDKRLNESGDKTLFFFVFFE
jgi:hypothetical protein